MRIAYLVNTYPLGSSTFIRRELQAVERRGVTISRFALRVGQSLVEPADIEEQQKTEYVLAVAWWRLILAVAACFVRSPGAAMAAFALACRLARRSRGGYARHAAYFVEACYLARRFRELGIQHVHTHFGTNAAAIAMMARALGGPAYSFTVHGPEEFDAPYALSLGDKIERAAFVVAVSSFGRSQLMRWCGAGHWPRIRVVHCGIEPAKFRDISPPQGRRRLVTVGRFVEQKGQLLLVEAMTRAVQTCPDLHLTMIGDGVLRGEIEAAIRAAGMETNVSLLGWKDETCVRQALAAADALVLPSFAEGLPVVVMEAMASARPVIVTQIAGIPELVTDGVQGWLVPAGDLQALAHALEHFALTPQDRIETMGRDARTIALQRHDIDRSALQLVDLFAAATQSAPIKRPFGVARWTREARVRTRLQEKSAPLNRGAGDRAAPLTRVGR